MTAVTNTSDMILGGALSIVQPRGGYRFAIDSVLLGRFAQPRPTDRVLELGAGCGVVAIMLAALYRPKEIVAVELQPVLARLIEQNASLNGTARLRAICADICQPEIAGLAPACFNYVVANPPYRAPLSGRQSPNASRRMACGGDGASLREFLAAAQRFAVNGGKIAMVCTAARSAELVTEMRLKSLEPKRIRFVHPMPGRPATMVLVEARKGGGIEAAIEAPLFLHSRPGSYSDEARALLGRPE